MLAKCFKTTRGWVIIEEVGTNALDAAVDG